MAGFGGMFAAMPQGYLQARQQQQQMDDEEAQRQLRLQQYQTTQRQAPMQDRLLQAQIAHMQRPDIGQQRYADERAATIQGAQLSPYASMPGATPMPQPPQGGTPQAFQNAQPMQGVSPGMPQPPQGQPPMSLAEAEHQPMGPFPRAAQGMPQGQPEAMYQQLPQQAMQPQGGVPQPQGMPSNDPVAQWHQQAMGELQQRVQALPPARTQQEQYQRALAIQQAQQQIQAQAKMMQEHAMGQLKVRTEAERERANARREDWRDSNLAQRGEYQNRSLGQRETNASRSSVTSQRDTDMRGLDNRLSSGAISGDQYLADKAAIDKKYAGIAPGAGSEPKSASIPPELHGKLEEAMRAKFGDVVPPSAVGQVIDVSGKKYKIINDGGEVGYELVK
jgi:hypothetical protein